MFKHLLLSGLVMTAIVTAMTVSTYAAFTATATLSGINFQTGNASLNIFGNIAYTNAGNNGNLGPTQPGPTLTNIAPNWSEDYLMKYFNNGTVTLLTSLSSEELNDPGNLSDHIYVEVWLWQDLDGNGQNTVGDTLTQLSTAVTLNDLATSPVNLGELDPGTPRGLLLKFSTGDLPSSTQAKQANFNFIIDGTTQGVTTE